MRVVISNLAWLDKSQLTESNLFLIKKKLTLIPKRSGYEQPDEEQKIIRMFDEREDRLGVPREFYHQNMTSRNEEVLDVSDGSPLSQVWSPIGLRPEDQLPLVDKVEGYLRSRSWGGGIVDAWTGFGKSRSAVELIRRFGKTALILVHKEPLMNQWAESIRELLPDVKIGFVQGPRCQYWQTDIVIGMAQSIMGETGDKYPIELYRAFGLIVVDEIHRFGSEQFCTACPKFNARYRLGLSGTVRRKDGCERAFKWTIGDIVAKADDRHRPSPIIYVRETGFRAVREERVNAETGEFEVFDMNDFKKPTQLGFISKNRHRNALIAHDTIKALEAGRNPLLMSDRIEMLEDVAQMVYEMGNEKLKRTVSNGFYFHGERKKKKEELNAAARCDVIYATTQLVQEGIDIPKLDTLLLCSPMSDPEQSIGRLRDLPGGPTKKRLMVVDYFDSSLDHFRGLFFSRYRLYKRLGWEVIGLKK